MIGWLFQMFSKHNRFTNITNERFLQKIINVQSFQFTYKQRPKDKFIEMPHSKQ